ncbi:predicted protein [Sclerotinia sclerotiorum 1980 UF-70]|uniref:Uncharacterized protein n=1 Tax=Sclerotinia sclerotiorum (strain ATCC 18683 / 1980 / Ss-1) TaxID=665079 RepID=A7EC43_SCLS1|nr:predicted protein [Sclerotinia sclerotiorum 1980 UF-70]EDO00022.1 predicted protein [Sclerotinia sclerotiorum 1980 UF-70]
MVMGVLGFCSFVPDYWYWYCWLVDWLVMEEYM